MPTLTEAEIVEKAAPLALKQARDRIAVLEAQVASHKAADPWQTWGARVRGVLLTAWLVVLFAATGYRALVWSWR
jgi:hypothetical protein